MDDSIPSDEQHKEEEEEPEVSDYEYHSSEGEEDQGSAEVRNNRAEEDAEYEFISSQEDEKEEEFTARDVRGGNTTNEETTGQDDDGSFAGVYRVEAAEVNEEEDDARMRQTWREMSDDTYTDFLKLCRKYCGGFANRDTSEAAIEKVLRTLLLSDSDVTDKFFNKDRSAEILLQVATLESVDDQICARIVRLMLMQAKKETVPEAFLIKLEKLYILPRFAKALRMTLEKGFGTRLAVEFLEQFASRVDDPEFRKPFEAQTGQREAHWNVLVLVTDALISIAGSPSSEQEFRARALQVVVLVLGFNDNLLDCMNVAESLISCVLGMDLDGQSKNDALRLITLLSFNSSCVAWILTSDYGADALRFIVRNFAANNFDDDDRLILDQWSLQLCRLPAAASVKRDLLFVLAESSVGVTLLCEYVDFLKTLIQVCQYDHTGCVKLRKLMLAPACLQGVSLDHTLIEMLAGLHPEVDLEWVTCISPSEDSKAFLDRPISWKATELSSLCRPPDRWSRLRALIWQQQTLHQLARSTFLINFLHSGLQSEASQNDAVAFVRMMTGALMYTRAPEGTNATHMAPFIGVYVHYLKLVLYSAKDMPLPLGAPQGSVFARALFKNAEFQQMFQQDSRRWAYLAQGHTIIARWMKSLMRLAFEEIKNKVEPEDAIHLAEWLDAVTRAGMKPPSDVEDCRFVVFVLAALASESASARAAESWLSSALCFPITTPPPGSPTAVDDLVTRLECWLKRAQVNDGTNGRILNLLTEVSSMLNSAFFVDWSSQLMPLGSREDVPRRFSLRWTNTTSTFLLMKWHGTVDPDHFLVNLLQAIGEGKARLPGEAKDRERQLSSPWFLHRVVEVYGTRTADVAIRRGAHRVLYDLTLDEASNTQLVGRVSQLAASSEWVQSLVYGLLDTFSEATVHETNGIVESCLEPALVNGDLELDDDCKENITELFQRLNRFCYEHGEQRKHARTSSG